MKLANAVVTGFVAMAAVAVSAGAQEVRWTSAAPLAPRVLVLQSDGVTATAQDEQKDDLLDGLEKLGANAKERNEVNLDKSMMALAGNRKGGRYSDLSQKMDSITIRNYEFAGKDQYKKSDLETLRHRLQGNGWSHIVRNESDGEINDIVVKSGGDGFISDMVILNAEAKELNIVHLRGHFRMEDVSGAMGSAMGMSASIISGRGVRSAPQSPAPPAPPAPPLMPPSKK